MKSASRLLLLAFVLGLGLRLLLLLAPGAALAEKLVEPTADSPEYVRLARNLVSHRVFSLDASPPYRPDIFRTPVYPLFLAAVFAVTQSSLVWAALAQILLSLAIVWLTYLLTRELGLEDKTAALAALIAGLSPNLAFFSTKLVTEIPFTLLLLVGLVLLNRFTAQGRWLDLVASGACLGVSVLTRPIATFFPLVLAAYLLVVCFRPRRVSWCAPLVLLAAATVVVVPWVVRNGRTSGRYVVSTVSEHNIYLYSGALVLAADKSLPLTAARDTMMAEAQAAYGPLDSNDEGSFWAALSKVGWQHVLARPLLAARIHAVGSAGSLVMPLSIRPLLVYAGTRDSVSPDNPNVAQQVIGLLARGRLDRAASLVWRERLCRMPALALVILGFATLFHACLLLFFAVGLLSRHNRSLLWLLLPILYFTLLTGPVGEARFRVPVEPLMALFAASGLAAVVQRKQKPAGQSPTGSLT